MIKLKGKLSKKDKERVSRLLDEIIDAYGDFYITKNNIRLFLRDNQHLLFSGLSKGDKIVFSDNAIAFITGFSDKAKRKYIKLLYKEPKDVSDLLKVIGWNLNIPLYCKIKKNNPVQDVLKKVGFRFRGGRGCELLLVRKKRNYHEKKSI
jgi:hypothetical protein